MPIEVMESDCRYNYDMKGVQKPIEATPMVGAAQPSEDEVADQTPKDDPSDGPNDCCPPADPAIKLEASPSPPNASHNSVQYFSTSASSSSSSCGMNDGPANTTNPVGNRRNDGNVKSEGESDLWDNEVSRPSQETVDRPVEEGPSSRTATHSSMLSTSVSYMGAPSLAAGVVVTTGQPLPGQQPPISRSLAHIPIPRTASATADLVDILCGHPGALSDPTMSTGQSAAQQQVSALFGALGIPNGQPAGNPCLSITTTGLPVQMNLARNTNGGTTRGAPGPPQGASSSNGGYRAMNHLSPNTIGNVTSTALHNQAGPFQPILRSTPTLVSSGQLGVSEPQPNRSGGTGEEIGSNATAGNSGPITRQQAAAAATHQQQPPTGARSGGNLSTGTFHGVNVHQSGPIPPQGISGKTSSSGGAGKQVSERVVIISDRVGRTSLKDAKSAALYLLLADKTPIMDFLGWAMAERARVMANPIATAMAKEEEWKELLLGDTSLEPTLPTSLSIAGGFASGGLIPSGHSHGPWIPLTTPIENSSMSTCTTDSSGALPDPVILPASPRASQLASLTSNDQPPPAKRTAKDDSHARLRPDSQRSKRRRTARGSDDLDRHPTVSSIEGALVDSSRCTTSSGGVPSSGLAAESQPLNAPVTGAKLRSDSNLQTNSKSAAAPAAGGGTGPYRGGKDPGRGGTNRGGGDTGSHPPSTGSAKRLRSGSNAGILAVKMTIEVERDLAMGEVADEAREEATGRRLDITAEGTKGTDCASSHDGVGNRGRAQSRMQPPSRTQLVAGNRSSGGLHEIEGPSPEATYEGADVTSSQKPTGLSPPGHHGQPPVSHGKHHRKSSATGHSSKQGAKPAINVNVTASPHLSGRGRDRGAAETGEGHAPPAARTGSTRTRGSTRRLPELEGITICSDCGRRGQSIFDPNNSGPEGEVWQYFYCRNMDCSRGRSNQRYIGWTTRGGK